jgi:hypothetical protein
VSDDKNWTKQRKVSDKQNENLKDSSKQTKRVTYLQKEMGKILRQ